jgi:chemotaxis protein CheD
MSRKPPPPADDPLSPHFLVPGELYCSTQPTVVTTVLGSCVSVCLWDPAHRIGGINHFILPHSRGDDRQAARYGDVAMVQLVDNMVRLGSRRTDLVAKTFGGANVLPYSPTRDTVGAQNVQLALEHLRGAGIPVAARRTGGETGLLVRFHTDSGIAYVRKIAP